MSPGIEIGLARTQADSFGQSILLGKVTVRMLIGQRASSIECGAERRRSKGTPFLLAGGEGSRLRNACKEFYQGSQGHSASPRGQERG